MTEFHREIDVENLWPIIWQEARTAADEFPLLADFYIRNLLDHTCFGEALAYILAEKLADTPEHINHWQCYLQGVLKKDPAIEQAALKDLLCQLQSNASIKDHYTPVLYFGGYQALQCYRFAHYFWMSDQRPVANFIQGKVVSAFGVDIHPAAKIGAGIFLDHAVGIVIGETAVVEDDVTLFQSVTLGGTGKGEGDRHPKVRKGAFIGSGAVIFGNIEIGEGAKIAGGAVVVKPVAPQTTVAGPLATALNQRVA